MRATIETTLTRGEGETETEIEVEVHCNYVRYRAATYEEPAEGGVEDIECFTYPNERGQRYQIDLTASELSDFGEQLAEQLYDADPDDDY